MTTHDLRLTSIPSVRVGMLIRRPATEVFQAFVDPAVTTRFWFTKSSGKLTPGAKVRWDWEMYGVGADVIVHEVEDDRRLVFQWDNADATTVEMRFTPLRDEGTYVQVTETGLSGTGDEIAAYLADSTGGFTNVLCALKALLEHGVELTVVLDHAPEGLGA